MRRSKQPTLSERRGSSRLPWGLAEITLCVMLVAMGCTGESVAGEGPDGGADGGITADSGDGGVNTDGSAGPDAQAGASWPTEADTGASVASCTKPKMVLDGDYQSQGPGTTIEDLDIRGELNIADPNVTVRCTRVARDTPSNAPWVLAVRPDMGTTTLDRVTITRGSKDGLAEVGVRVIGSGAVAMTKVQVIETGDGCNPCANTEIRDSYIRLLPDPVVHNDGVQVAGGSVTLIHNTILNPNNQTSALALFNENSPVHDVLIEGNWLAGGGYTVYAGDDPSGINRPDGPVVFRNNVFSREYYEDVGSFGYGRDFCETCPGALWEGNVFASQAGDVTSETVPAP